MGQVTFILSPPRCRTAWLSLYLTGMGVYCFHELWREVNNIEDFVSAIESKGPGPVANADCSNWFFLPELIHAFPEATFIEITREREAVVQSCEVYGEGDYHVMMDAYDRAKEASGAFRPDFSLPYENWHQGFSWYIAKLAGCGSDSQEDWHCRLHGLNVQISEQRRTDDAIHVLTGKADHIIERMNYYAGRPVWE